jgi:uncharacterized protein DUF6763
MSDQPEPVVGKWYRDAELDEQFRVLAIDEEREVVEIQYLDGEADEIELEAWSDLDLEAAEPPDEESEDDEDDTRESRWSDRDAGEADDWEDDDEDDEDDDWDDDEDDDGGDNQYGSE